MHKLARGRCRLRLGQRFTARGQSYEFLGALGDGAVGLVRKAKNLAGGSIVAVKVLAPDPKYIDPEAFDDVEQRFKREGSRGAQLRDDNLVTILAYESNEDGSCFEGARIKNPFIVMEYVQGRTLESLIKKLGASALVPGQAHVTKPTVTIALKISKALEHLHDRKVVHRDVKPANIFLSSAGGLSCKYWLKVSQCKGANREIPPNPRGWSFCCSASGNCCREAYMISAISRAAFCRLDCTFMPLTG